MKPHNVKIVIGEPWEFPWESWAAEIQERKDEYLLIKLREKIRYKNTDVIRLIAEPRSYGKSLDCIEQGQELVICMTPIAEESPCSMEECLDFAKKWRGWFLQGSIAIDKNARHHRLRPNG